MKRNQGKTPITVVLVLLVFVLATTSFYQYQQVRALSANEEILQFANLFIETVLVQETPITVDQRLALEEAVRKTEDREILSEWQSFTESKDNTNAEKHTVNLLHFLIGRLEEN